MANITSLTPLFLSTCLYQARKMSGHACVMAINGLFLWLFFIGFWNCSDSVGFCFPFYLLAFGTVPTVLVFACHFIYWLLELFRQCWFLFSIFYWFLELFRQCWFLFSILFIGFWNCSDSVGFCFPFFLLTFGTVPTLLVFVFHFIIAKLWSIV